MNASGWYSQRKSASMPLLNTSMPSMCDRHLAQDWSLTQNFYLQQLGQLHVALQQKYFRKAEVQDSQIYRDIAINHSAQCVWQFIPFHKCDKVPYLQLFLQLTKKDFIMQKHLNTVYWSSCQEI
jgi:hypothetical protein